MMRVRMMRVRRMHRTRVGRAAIGDGHWGSVTWPWHGPCWHCRDGTAIGGDVIRLTRGEAEEFDEKCLGVWGR